MSYTENINQQVLEFYDNTINQVLKSREKLNNINYTDNIQEQQQQQQQQIDQDQLYDYVENFIKKNPLWLLPDDKEIVIQIHYNDKLIEEWKLQFFHKFSYDDSEIMQENNSIPDYLELKNYDTIRDPQIFSQILEQLKQQISIMLNKFPLVNQGYDKLISQQNQNNQITINTNIKFNNDIKFDQKKLQNFYRVQQKICLLQHYFQFQVDYLLLDTDLSQDEKQNNQENNYNNNIDEDDIFDENYNEQFHQRNEEILQKQSQYQKTKKQFRKVSDNDLTFETGLEKQHSQKPQQQQQNQKQQEFSQLWDDKSLQQTIPCLQYKQSVQSEKKIKLMNFQERINNMQYRLKQIKDPYPRKLAEVQKILEAQVQSFENQKIQGPGFNNNNNDKNQQQQQQQQKVQ